MKNKISKTLLALTLSGAMCVTPFTASAAKSSMALAGTSTSSSGISISTDASGKITNMGSSISNIGYASGGNSTGISYGADGNTNFGCYSGGTSTMAYTGISTSKKQSCVPSMVAKPMCTAVMKARFVRKQGTS